MYEVLYLVGCMQVDIAAKKLFCYFDTSILYSQHEGSRSSDLQVQKVMIIIIHMWQSWVEIEHNSIAYFNCITAFEVM